MSLAIQPASLAPSPASVYRYLASLFDYVQPGPVQDKKTPSSKKKHSAHTGAARHSKRNRDRLVLQAPLLVQAPPLWQTIAHAQPPHHEPELRDVIQTIIKPKSGTPGTVDPAKGDDRKLMGKVRWEGQRMFAWVDDTWKPAAYHLAHREKFILMDAQQPDAPVWTSGMDLNYTSYSPVTRGWNENPESILDSQGRQVILMPDPPEDWAHNAKNWDYLYSEGLIIVDQYNRLIKNYPGAPLALHSEAPDWLLEGLRRTFGMTVYDLRARMLPVWNGPRGPKKAPGYTSVTNRLGRWKNNVVNQDKDSGPKIMFPWHHRDKHNQREDDLNDQSDPEAEEDDEDDMDSEAYSASDHPHSSSLVTPMARPAPNGFAQHQTQRYRPILPRNEQYHFSGATGIPAESYSVGQSRTEFVEQTSGDSQFDLPTFPGTNWPGQTANTVPPESIYFAGYPSTFPHQNIYSTLPAQNENTVASDIYSAGYPSTFDRPSIYSTAGYPFNSQIYPVPPNHLSPYTPAAADYGNFTPLTDSVATAQPSSNGERNTANQPISTASSVSVSPAENANISFSSPEADPFMGADDSPGTTEDWLGVDDFMP